MQFTKDGCRRCSYIYMKLSYRRETTLQSGLVMAKSGRLRLGDDICRHYRSIFNHCDVIRLQSYRIRWKKPQNKGYYAIWGHLWSLRLVPIVSPHATWLILTDIQSCTVLNLLQVIVQILDTAFLIHPLGAYGQHTLFILGSVERLPIHVNWTIHTRCYGWGATS